MTTLLESYTSYLSNTHVVTLSNLIFPRISEWIKLNKGFDVSVDDMMSALKIEKTTSFTLNAPTSSLIPTPVSTGNGRKKANTSKSTEPEVVDPNGGCIYIFTRKSGDKKKGDKCAKPTVNGTAWCKACLKKDGGGGQGKKATPTNAVAAGLTPAATALTIPSLTQLSSPDVIYAKIEFLQHKIPGYFIEEITNIVFNKEEVDKIPTYMAYCVYDYNTNTFNPLTNKELDYLNRVSLKPCTDPIKSVQVINDMKNKRSEALQDEVKTNGAFVVTSALPQVGLHPGMNPMMNMSNGIPSFGVPNFGAATNNNSGFPVISALPQVAANPSMAMPNFGMPGMGLPQGVNMQMMSGLSGPSGVPTFGVPK
jgi:hypothetical protein